MGVDEMERPPRCHLTKVARLCIACVDAPATVGKPVCGDCLPAWEARRGMKTTPPRVEPEWEPLIGTEMLR